MTLTFGANWNARKSRNKVDRFFSFLREVYGFHTGSTELASRRFVGAEELGEMGARYHLHVLLADLKKGGVSKSDCFAMAWLWMDTFKGGFAKIRPYNPALHGVGYVLKTLRTVDLRAISSDDRRNRAIVLAGAHVADHSTSFDGANRFEVGKMGAASECGTEVMLSHGLVEWLSKRANSPEERRKVKSLDFLQRRHKRSGLKTEAAMHTGDKRRESQPWDSFCRISGAGVACADAEAGRSSLT